MPHGTPEGTPGRSSLTANQLAEMMAADPRHGGTPPASSDLPPDEDQGTWIGDRYVAAGAPDWVWISQFSTNYGVPLESVRKFIEIIGDPATPFWQVQAFLNQYPELQRYYGGDASTPGAVEPEPPPPPPAAGGGGLSSNATTFANAVAGPTSPDLNLGYGADFLPLALDAYLQMLGLGETKAGRLQQNTQFFAGLGQQGEQFNQQALFQAAQALAQLGANPYSAAELAFMRKGLGFEALGANGMDIRELITSGTERATGVDAVDFGTQSLQIPRTLSGRQATQVARDPNLTGVMESFARAAGNPDLLTRSLFASLPSGFSGVGSGLR